MLYKIFLKVTRIDPYILMFVLHGLANIIALVENILMYLLDIDIKLEQLMMKAYDGFQYLPQLY